MMKFPKFLILSLASLHCVSMWAGDDKAPKPFQNAVVFEGGGNKIAMFIGMYDAMVKAGHPPDVIIGTVSGSIAAAIIKAIPDPAERMKFVNSQKFQDFMRSIDTQGSWAVTHAWHVDSDNQKHKDEENGSEIPPVFGNTILNLTDHLPFPELHKAFTSDTPRVVMVASIPNHNVAAEELAKDYNVVSHRGDTFKEVFVTDPETAKYFQGFESPTHKLFPWSRVESETQTITNLDLADGARGSATDYFYYTPVLFNQLGGKSLGSGSIDLYAQGVAQHLANHTTINFDEEVNDHVLAAEKRAYGTDQTVDQRVAYDRLNRDGADWIDLSDANTVIGGKGFDLGWDGGVSVALNVPKNHATYVEYQNALYDYGYQRATEAFVSKTINGNTISLIRKVDDLDASRGLQAEIKKKKLQSQVADEPAE